MSLASWEYHLGTETGSIGTGEKYSSLRTQGAGNATSLLLNGNLFCFCLFVFIFWLCVMVVQNKLTQDVPQWYIDYFELKAILVSGSRKMSVPLINCLEFE